MNNADIQYLQVANKILWEGAHKGDRTGTGTLSIFGPQMRFDLSEGFPLLTTKKTNMRIIAEELFWFISGDTNIRTLLDKKVNIWNDDAYRWHLEQNPNSTMTKERFLEVIQMGDSDNLGFGDLGPVYGKQWRSWDTPSGEVIDQLQNVVESIRNNPDSRRHIVSAWNPGEMKDMALPPCHIMFQFYVAEGKLHSLLFQRSGDFFLGVPFNIASYALLTHLIAKMTDLEVGEFVHNLGDAHIYLNHIEQVKEQTGRRPKSLPKLHILRKKEYIGDYNIDDIVLEGYDPHPPIKGKLSVGL